MEQTKRQNIIYNDNEKNKWTINSNSASRKFITQFEDLSNEIIYEVFEFLDFYHIHQAFFDLNIRFQNLLIHSNFPINIDLSLKSKTSFQCYYKNILIPYQHRIKSLHISNPLIIERIFSLSLDTQLVFKRLEKLTLHNITSILLEQLFTHFISSSYLFSLDIKCKDIVQDERNLYRQIFRLPMLKYCKLFCEHCVSHRSLPVATNEYSPIEYLVIKHRLQLNEMNALLSYVPQLRRLSLRCESHLSDTEIISSSIVLNHLTHVSLNIYDFIFDQVESIMKNLFQSVQVLYISIGTEKDATYFDANRWKQLVSTLPYIRIFDISIFIFDRLYSHNDYMSQIDKFNSSFWIERQWFFEHTIYHDKYDIYYYLYSINPYRRKNFTFCGSIDENTNTNGQKCNIDSVDFVSISNGGALNNCEYYFSNITRLKLRCYSFANIDSTHLNRIIPLDKLTILEIDLIDYCCSDIIEILQQTPNIHTLNILFVGMFCTPDLILFEQNESFRLVSETNKIKKMKIKYDNTLEMTKFLILLCPRLEHLTIKWSENSLKTLLQFLLSEDNNNTRYLSSLLIEDVSQNQIETFKTFIESEKLNDISFIKVENHRDSMIYLWW